ncbi:dye-decolorizing heme-containing peroxidase [Marasmius crinis-equi]|uniref:Dye-decolorizing heme-containing peroxidase n=1 Tax=Marasmius crinis-equi TaxID=585013 RepID=A0ABR3FCM9_9AGAR
MSSPCTMFPTSGFRPLSPALRHSKDAQRCSPTSTWQDRMDSFARRALKRSLCLGACTPTVKSIQRLLRGISPLFLTFVQTRSARHAKLDTDNVQGLTMVRMRFMKEVFFFNLTTVNNLKIHLDNDFYPHVTTATQLADPTKQSNVVSNIVFSRVGFNILEVEDNLGSSHFNVGQAKKAVLLGDPGTTKWHTEYHKGMHGAIQIAAKAQDKVDEQVQKIKDMSGDATQEVYRFNAFACPGEVTGHKHFGWVDGITQPGVEGWDTDKSVTLGQAIVKPGVILLGGKGAPIDLSPLQENATLGADTVRRNNFTFDHPKDSAKNPTCYVVIFLTDPKLQRIRLLGSILPTIPNSNVKWLSLRTGSLSNRGSSSHRANSFTAPSYPEGSNTDVDAVIGSLNQEPPGEAPRILTDFVTTRGGEYFSLPVLALKGRIAEMLMNGVTVNPASTSMSLMGLMSSSANATAVTTRASSGSASSASATLTSSSSAASSSSTGSSGGNMGDMEGMDTEASSRLSEPLVEKRTHRSVSGLDS